MIKALEKFRVAAFDSTDLERINSAILMGHLSGKKRTGITEEFEVFVENFFDAQNALAMNNGTAALFSAYQAIDLKDGDEVIVPSFGWHACVMPLRFTQATVRFCDVDPETFNMDLEQLNELVTDRTKAVLALHTFGVPLKMDQVIAKSGKARIIEDCSHAIGVRYQGRMLGTFGDLGCMSLQHGKLISGGEAGLLLTDNRELAERIIQHGLPGRSKILNGASTGLKFRPHPLSLILALSQFKKRDLLNDELRKGYSVVESELSAFDSAITFQKWKGERSYYHCRFFIKDLSLTQRKTLLENLKVKTDIIQAEDYFYLPDLPIKKIEGVFKVGRFLQENLICVSLPKVLNAENEDLLRKSLSLLMNELRSLKV